MFYFLTMYHSIFFNYIIIFFTYICIYYANAIITKFYISYYDKIIYGFDPNIMKYKTITFNNIFIRHHHINKKVLYTDIFIFVTYNTFSYLYSFKNSLLRLQCKSFLCPYS